MQILLDGLTQRVSDCFSGCVVVGDIFSDKNSYPFVNIQNPTMQLNVINGKVSQDRVTFRIRLVGEKCGFYDLLDDLYNCLLSKESFGCWQYQLSAGQNVIIQETTATYSAELSVVFIRNKGD